MQRVWDVDTIGNIAVGGIALAPTAQFAAGIAWLATRLNATVRLPLEFTAAGDALNDGRATDCATVTVVTSAAMTQGPA